MGGDSLSPQIGEIMNKREGAVDINQELKVRMQALGIREEDIEEQFICSSGKGGQNVNKVATCVYLHHRPSGTRVKCQQERSQQLNRLKARAILLQKIETQQKRLERIKIDRREKQRRQNRKRPKGLKEAILANKRLRSQKKSDRQKIRIEKDL